MEQDENAPRILHVLDGVPGGGASIAAMRLHSALLELGVDSVIAANSSVLPIPHMVLPEGRVSLTKLKFARGVELAFRRATHSLEGELRSLALMPGPLPSLVREVKPSIVHVHWAAGGSASIQQLSRLAVPIVWTLHDAWPLIGTRHYPRLKDDEVVDTPEESDFGVRLQGLDRVHHLASQRLRHSVRKWIAPSLWMKDLAAMALAAQDSRIQMIPNAVPEVFFGGAQMRSARLNLGLPLDVPMLLFVAGSGLTDRRKGADLLERTLEWVWRKDPHVRVLVVVPNSDSWSLFDDSRVIRRESTRQVSEMVNFYAAADVAVVPSRMDNAPQVVTEAISIGRPVAAFAVGGLPDLLNESVLGTTVRGFDPQALAGACVELLGAARIKTEIEARRLHGRTHWSGRTVAEVHRELYRRLTVH